MKIKHIIIGGAVVAGLFALPVLASTLQGFQGGTGISTTTAGNVGNCLQVSSSSPFLTWSVGACGSGGSSTLIFAGSFIGVTASGTNGYIISNTGVTSTAGLLTTSTASNTYYLLTNPAGYVSSSIINGLISSSSAWSSFYPLSNPAGYVTSTGSSATGTPTFYLFWNSSGTPAQTSTFSVAGATGNLINPNGIWVTGSSTPNYNGFYVQSGTNAGHPTYIGPNGAIWSEGYDWFISPAVNSQTLDFYVSLSGLANQPPPSITSWNAQNGASGNVATISNGLSVYQGLTVNATSNPLAVPFLIEYPGGNSTPATPIFQMENSGSQSGFAFTFGGVPQSQIRADNAGNMIYASKGTQYFGYATDYSQLVPISFGNNISNPYMYIPAAGNVGINTTVPKSTLTVNGSLATQLQEVSASTTLTSSSSIVGVIATSTSHVVITLPDATTVAVGSVVTVTDEIGAASSYPITVAAAAGQYINGKATTTIATNQMSLDFYGNGTNWYIK